MKTTVTATTPLAKRNAPSTAGVALIENEIDLSGSSTSIARGTDEAPPAKIGRHPLAWRLGAAALIVVAIGAAIGWRIHARTWESTDNAYTAAHVHTVSARVAGTIQEIYVDENQPVSAGTVLARLDPGDFDLREQQAAAQLAQAQAQVQQAQAQVIQAGAQLTREQARSSKARRDLERAQTLMAGGSGAISRQEFDQAQTEYDSAEAAKQAAEANLESARALAKVAAAQEQVAQVNLKDAELQLSYTRIVAPVAGRVGKKNLETGNWVQPGQALLALVQPEIWVTANFKETQLGRIAPGQMVRVRIDAFPGRSFVGKVDGISPASGAQFALLPPDNATGNFTRIVQRVAVKVLLDAKGLGEGADRIAAGMSAIVQVKVGGGR